MPTLSSSTVVRHAADGIRLALTARHILSIGQPSETIHTTKARLPESVVAEAIPADEDIILVVRGTVNKSIMNGIQILESGLMDYLTRYLKLNAEQLGWSEASRACINKNGLVQVRLSSTGRVWNPDRARVRLHCVELEYAWRTPEDTTGELHPFAANLLLPFESILNNTVPKFVTNHLVKRYPMIFGPWRAKLDESAALYPRIARSILHIMDRSSDSDFKAKTSNLIKGLQRRNDAAEMRLSHEIADFISSIPGIGGDVEVVDDLRGDTEAPCDVEHLTTAMANLFKIEVRPARFKGALIGAIEVEDFDLPDLEESLSQPIQDDDDAHVTQDPAAQYPQAILQEDAMLTGYRLGDLLQQCKQDEMALPPCGDELDLDAVDDEQTACFWIDEDEDEADYSELSTDHAPANSDTFFACDTVDWDMEDFWDPYLEELPAMSQDSQDSAASGSQASDSLETICTPITETTQPLILDDDDDNLGEFGSTVQLAISTQHHTLAYYGDGCIPVESAGFAAMGRIDIFEFSDDGEDDWEPPELDSPPFTAQPEYDQGSGGDVDVLVEGTTCGLGERMLI